MIEAAARGAQFLLAIGIAYVVALWFALVAWAFRDIESRSRSVFTQVFSTLLVVLFFVPGLLLYLILRPKETLDQAFQRALEEEYLLQDLDDLPLCPGCQRSIEAEFVICPNCQTRLRGPCPSCSRLIDLRWSVCPYCAVPVDAHAIEGPQVALDSIRKLDNAREARRKRAVTAAAQRVGLTPDELDAFSDALAPSPNATAVGAGEIADRQSSALHDLTQPLRGVRERLSQLGLNANSGVEKGAETPSADSTTTDGRPTGSGFWADPVHGSNRDNDNGPRRRGQRQR